MSYAENPYLASGATLAVNWGKKHQAAVLFGNDCMFAMSPVYASMAAEALLAEGHMPKTSDG